MSDERSERIIRAPHDRNNAYFICSRATPQDETLSWEARGVLWYLLSKPDTWELRPKDLEQECGRDKVRAILNELLEHCYIRKVEQSHGQGGKFTATTYEVYERPFTENPSTVEPSTANPLHRELETERELEREIPPAKDFDHRPPTELRRTGELPKHLQAFASANSGDLYTQGLNRAAQIKAHPIWKAYVAGWKNTAPDPAPFEAEDDWRHIELLDMGVTAGKYTLDDVTACTRWKWANWKGGRAMRIQYVYSDMASFLEIRGKRVQANNTPQSYELPAHVQGFSLTQFVPVKAGDEHE